MNGLSLIVLLRLIFYRFSSHTNISRRSLQGPESRSDGPTLPPPRRNRNRSSKAQHLQRPDGSPDGSVGFSLLSLSLKPLKCIPDHILSLSSPSQILQLHNSRLLHAANLLLLLLHLLHAQLLLRLAQMVALPYRLLLFLTTYCLRGQRTSLSDERMRVDGEGRSAARGHDGRGILRERRGGG